MIKKLVKNPIFWIFILALILRIYKLGTFPFGFHVDEVKVGWEALSILKTGADDHGSILAPYYNSFGDYRPTGIFYFTIPSLIAFGRSEFAVRFPSALFGALTVLPVYLIGQFLFLSKKFKYLPAFLLAISPWAVETSRATSEVVISTFFALFAIYYFLKLIEKYKKEYVIKSVIFTLISFSLYHSIRVLIPVFFLIITLYYFREIKKAEIKKGILIVLGIAWGTAALIGLTKSARERFGQVSIFKDIDLTYQIQRTASEDKTIGPLSLLFDNKIVIYGTRLINEYSTYFSPQFLIGNAAKPYRYTTPGVGLLTFAEAILLLAGAVQILRGKGGFLILFLLLASPIPAFLTSEDSPNLHRAFLMLPFLIYIETYGLLFLMHFKRIFKFAVLFLILGSLFFVHQYFSHSLNHQPFIKNLPLDNASYRNLGEKELAIKINQISGSYDKIIISGFPDNLYPYFAFFNGLDPKAFNKNVARGQKGVVEYKNIIFSNMRCPSDDSFINYFDKNILVADFADCPYESKIRDGLPIKVDSMITRPDGIIIYVLLVKTGPIPDKFLKK